MFPRLKRFAALLLLAACAAGPATAQSFPTKPVRLVVLGDDIARVPVKDLRHLPIAMTVVEGNVVYEA